MATFCQSEINISKSFSVQKIIPKNVSVKIKKKKKKLSYLRVRH